MTNILYDINVVIMSMIIILIVLLMSGIDMVLGLCMIGFVWIFQVQSYINPDNFQYAWRGKYNIIRVILAVSIYIPALIILLKNKKDSPYECIVLAIMTMILLPECIIPGIIDSIDSIWFSVSGSKRIAYMLRDVIIPSVSIAFILMVLGRYSKHE